MTERRILNPAKGRGANFVEPGLVARVAVVRPGPAPLTVLRLDGLVLPLGRRKLE
jgi:hypothetical protein